MSSDNLLLALSASLSSARDILVPYFQDEHKSRLERELLGERQKMADTSSMNKANYENKLAFDREKALIPLRQDADLQKSKAEYEMKLPFEKEKLDVQKQRIEAAKGISERNAKAREDKANNIPAAQVGIATLAEDSLVNLSKAEKTLFPDGTPSSFKRGIAVAANVPGSRTPIIGNFIPNSSPFSKDGQNLRRWLGNSLAARQLVTTGVAANPKEIENLTSSFISNFGSDPTAFYEALQEQKRFYSRYIGSLKNKGSDLEGESYKKFLPTDTDGGDSLIDENDPLGLGDF